MPKVRVAIVGCGVLTRDTILPHLVQPDFCDRAELVALADLIPERAEQAARDFGVPKSFGSLAEMLAVAEFEALLIIVPGPVHAEHALLAIEHGKHIYVQKPMATNAVDARTMVAAANKRGVKLVAAPGQVLWPLYRQIGEALREGTVGKPYMAVTPLLGWPGHTVHFGSDPRWFYSDQGGPLRDHGGYGIQSLVAMFGPVRRVFAFSGAGVADRTWQGQAFPVTGHDNTAALLDFGDNIFGLVPEGWCDSSPSARVLRIHCLEGNVETSHESCNGLTILPYSATVRPLGKEPIHIEAGLDRIAFVQGKHIGLGHVHVYGDILHLLDCIEQDLVPQASGERGLHFVDVVDAAFRAAQTGLAQEVPDPGITFVAGEN